MSLTRRAVLAGLAASVPAMAEAGLERSFRPRLRPVGTAARVSKDTGFQPILARSGLGDISGFAVRDLSDGRLLESHRDGAELPPASVTKSLTALYGLRALGPSYAFRTQVAVSGPVQDGRVRGDLYLIGGGDPHLDTDGLADLAKAVVAAGIHGVTGRAYVVAGALPYHRSIDPEQPEYVGYNPAISGMNLNFNRVHFEWKPVSQGYSMRMSARAERHDPEVRSVEMRIIDRAAPLFDYRRAEGRDLWSVSAAALGKGGSRWLPVRTPEIYAAEVFRAVAAGVNLRLPDLVPVAAAQPGLSVVAESRSAEMAALLRSMLRYSTNLTAEVVGLRAHQALGGTPGNVSQSAEAMGAWLKSTHGLGRARFLNHSGLTDETRISAAEMVQVLDIAAGGQLPDLLREIPLADENGKRLPESAGRVLAKTGTLNFARGLAGYINGRNGRRLAFAIFSADLAKRADLESKTAESPRGGKRWTGVARAQEMALLRRWSELYG